MEDHTLRTRPPPRAASTTAGARRCRTLGCGVVGEVRGDRSTLEARPARPRTRAGTTPRDDPDAILPQWGSSSTALEVNDRPSRLFSAQQDAVQRSPVWD